ncbi:MAG: ATP-binding protein [Myxococcota bacterium]|nr:ATP-binding protein [Myxococcota bacterium]
MGVQTQSALIAALILIGLSVNVLFERRRVEHRVAFGALVGGFALFNLCWFAYSISSSGFWLRVLLLSGIVVAQTCLSFFERFLSKSMGTERTIIWATSGILVLTLPSDLVHEPLVPSLVATLSLGTYAWCIWQLYGRYRESQNEVEKTRLSYLVIGGAVSVILSTTDLMPAFNLPSPAIGHIWLTVYMYFWMQVVLRSRLLDLQEILSRGIALVILSTLISLIYVGLLIWVDDSTQLGLFFFNTVAASMLLFFIFEPLKLAVDRWSGRLFFRARHDLEMALQTLNKDLTKAINLDDVISLVMASLRASRHVTHASVFILESGGHAYRLAIRSAHIGELERHVVDVVRDRAFLDALSQEQVLILEQVDGELLDLGGETHDSPQRKRLSDIQTNMQELSAQLSFAFVSGKRLLGFLNLQDDRNAEAFSSYEIALFAGLSAQISTAIENSELVRQIKERDRLSALGEMATGMAHEIRNPLAGIKSAAQLFQPTVDDPDAESLRKVIVDEANRLDSVLSQFLNFARPFRGELIPLYPHELLERVATLVKAEEREQEINVTVDASTELPLVVGDPDQLHQVCLNLARNACQAMDTEGGSLTLGAQVVVEDIPGRPGQTRKKVEISVKDTGPGMPSTIMESLFIPFFTTKTKGTGLGLPICQRLLQHHGTEISVSSLVGFGTTMSFRLTLEEDVDALTGEHRRVQSSEMDRW